MSGRVEVASGTLDRARKRLATTGPIGAGLAECSRPLGYLHDRSGGYVMADRIIADHAGFAGFVGAALPGIAPHDVAALWQATTADAAERPAMQVVLDRALDPLAGLATYPDAVLFSESERTELAAIEREPLAVATLPRGAVTGIVKVTRHCNLRCSYCHDWRTGRDAAMPFAVLARTMRWLVAGSNARTVNIVLHGGEPSLLGVDGLIRLLALQARYRPDGVTVATRMQTNGARMTTALVDMLVRYGVGSAVSLDGPPEVHDRTRLTVAGTGSSAAARDAIARLRQAGVLNGVLIVVTPALIAVGAERLVRWLSDEGIDAIALLAMRPAATDAAPGRETSLPTDTFCDFLVAVDRWRAEVHPALSVREIDAAMAALDGGDPRSCELQGFCIGHYVSIEPDGTVSHCDKFVGDPAYVIGTIAQPFDAVVGGAAARRLQAVATGAARAKQGCRWWAHCRGWCPHEDYVARRLGEPEGCCGLAPLFAALADRHAPVTLTAEPADAAY